MTTTATAMASNNNNNNKQPSKPNWHARFAEMGNTLVHIIIKFFFILFQLITSSTPSMHYLSQLQHHWANHAWLQWHTLASSCCYSLLGSPQKGWMAWATSVHWQAHIAVLVLRQHFIFPILIILSSSHFVQQVRWQVWVVFTRGFVLLWIPR